VAHDFRARQPGCGAAAGRGRLIIKKKLQVIKQSIIISRGLKPNRRRLMHARPSPSTRNATPKNHRPEASVVQTNGGPPQAPRALHRSLHSVCDLSLSRLLSQMLEGGLAANHARIISVVCEASGSASRYRHIRCNLARNGALNDTSM
jgi:hypothetical protein